ncbi:MAG: undecaprenyl/decaprenyl-phosphate alpha-N-acetylglucosaminyl 1-phosphate transferase [Planctomycetota bacterium]|nr:MAG: undecaprenyl/decaprenyl-phosphate alpha-N-acetylglucosaminyl 1-phosphate transferase [Planctomycetota bacterium]
MLANSGLTTKLSYPHVGMLIFAWFLAFLVVPYLIVIAKRIGALDRPKEYKTHKEATPFLGGIAIYIAFSITVFSTLRIDPGTAHSFIGLITFEWYRPFFGLVTGGLIVLILGLIDDFHPINAIWKLIILFGVTYFLYSFGIRLTLFPAQLGFAAMPLNLALTLLWIVGVTSAMNSLDNMDGAAVGVTAIASAFIFYFAWGSDIRGAQPWLAFLAISLTGACLGFLRYNWNPAKIFLGDNGSFLLGFLLAAMLVIGKWSFDPLKSMIVPCVVLTVPLYDITLSTILRFKNKTVKTGNLFGNIKGAILYCGRDHLSHRLKAFGLSTRQAAMSLYLLGIAGGLIALIIWKLESPAAYLSVLGVYIIALILGGWALDRAKV